MLYSQLKYLIKVAKKKFIVNRPDVIITQICKAINILPKYNGYLNLINNKIAVHLRL